ncbi:non-ribosomal peptide synthetase [Roseibium sp. Sym1]|uniref:non-ribosomal peptide synthetase n=1 Tax=Roseibium sp. Sym1 TaxID=3016006 RepID=UPI0022B420A9|nr:non-ribosomal peptide synthetase [Roseibium sp. Sym1]
MAKIIHGQVPPGGRVLLCLTRPVDVAIGLIGCLRAGAVAVPTPQASGKHAIWRIEAIARDCDASLAILPAHAAAVTPVPGLPAISVDPECAPVTGQEDLPATAPDDLAVLQYTSGSTQSPRGVCLTRAMISRHLNQIIGHFGLVQDDVFVNWLPMHHDLGLFGTLLTPLYLGARSHYLPARRFLGNPYTWLGAISTCRATVAGGPNFAFEHVLRASRKSIGADLDLSHWRVAFCGAEPVRSETLSRFSTAFAEHGFDARAFCPTYGLAEATLVVSGVRARVRPRHISVDPNTLIAGRVEQMPGGKTIVSNGTPLDGIRVAIVDPASRTVLPEGGVGEICASGPAIASAAWGGRDAERFSTPLDGEGAYLRTGDIGFLDQGELFICGRKSDVLVLAGRNHHPEDLERSVERLSDAIRPGGSAAVPLETAEGEQAALLVECAQKLDGQTLMDLAVQLRAEMAEQHEIAPAIIALLKPGALPRTSSGKVRRKAAAQAWRAGEMTPLCVLEQNLERPDAPVETGGLRGVVARALGVSADQIDPTRKLTEYGLDSLKAMHLAAALENTAAKDVTPGWLLAGHSLQDIEDRLEGVPITDNRAVHPTPGAQIALNPVQRAFWYLDRLGTRGTADVIAGAIQLNEMPGFEHLREAFLGILAKHPLLQSVVATFEGDLAFAPADAKQERVRHIRVEDAPAKIKELLAEPMDLETGPLVALDLVEEADGAPLLLLRLHHIVGDMRTVECLWEQLKESLQGDWRPPETPLQDAFGYSEDAVRAWQEKLSPNLADLPELPGDTSTPDAVQGAEHTLRIGSSLSKDLRVFAQRRGVTVPAVLLTALQILRARLADAGKAVTSVSVSNRTRLDDMTAIGCFAHVLPVSMTVPPMASFSQMVQQCAAELGWVLDHQSVPLSAIAPVVEAAGEDGMHPVSRMVFSWYDENAGDGDPALTAMALNVPDVPLPSGPLAGRTYKLPDRPPQFPLMVLGGWLGNRLHLTLRSRSNLFDETGLERLSQRIEQLLAQALDRPETQVCDLHVLLAQERAEINKWNDTRRPCLLNRDLFQAFQDQANQQPGAVALSSDAGQLTYCELATRARRVAAALQACGVTEGTVVALSLPRQLEYLAVILGILALRAVFVPIEVETPVLRRNRQLEQAKASVLITSNADQAEDTPIRTLSLDEAMHHPLEVLPGRAEPEDGLAYILFTSGSTGQPKAVGVPRSALANRLDWMQQAFQLRPGERVLHKTPVSFDVSIWELLWPLLYGGELVIAAPGGHRDPHYIADLIVRRDIHFVHFVPSMLKVFLQAWALEARDPPSLKHCICSGEALPAPLASRAQSSLQCTVSNLYGPTEAAIDVTAWVCSPQDRVEVPIGWPISNVVTEVLDRQGNRLPPGCLGELAIGGVALAWGYMGNAGLTADRFRPDPFRPGKRLYLTGDLVRQRRDGALTYHGRRDSQIKRRGQRIELGEIEATLLEHSGIAWAGVTARPDAAGDIRIHAFCVPTGRDLPDDLGGFVEARLPPAFWPDTYQKTERLWTTQNGKLDRKALAELAPTSPERRYQEAPVCLDDPTEQRLAAIWTSVLNLPTSPQSSTNFFRAGGHSLLLARLQLVIEQEFGVRVPLALLAGAADMSKMSDLIKDARVSPAHLPQAARGMPGKDTVLPLSSAQLPLFLKEHISGSPGLFNMPIGFVLDSEPGHGTIQKTLGWLSDRHPALRTSFELQSGKPVQVIRRQAQVPFDVRDAKNADPRELMSGRLSNHDGLPGNPPLQVRLFRLGDGRSLLRFDLHHLVADRQSASALMQEFCSVFKDCEAGDIPKPAPPRASIEDLLAWEADQFERSKASRYWANRLHRAAEPSSFPTDGAPSGQAASIERRIPAETVSALTARAGEQEATLYGLLVTAYGVLVQRLTGKTDLLCGMPVSLRPNLDYDDMLGCFVAVLPLSLDFSRSDRVPDRLQTTQDILFQALDHRWNAPGPANPNLPKLPPYRSILQLVEPHPDLSISGRPVQVISAPESQGKTDLIWTFVRSNDGAITLHLSYDTGAYGRPSAERLLSQFIALLRGIAEQEDGSMFHLSLTEDHERAR